MNNYRISEFTLAIVPHGNNESICYEIDDKIIVKKKTNFIISKNCINFGSSMSGRKDFTEHLTGYIYKAPILVHEEKKLIFFPTASTRNKDCSWINLDNIDYTYYDNDKLLVSKEGLEWLCENCFKQKYIEAGYAYDEFCGMN